MTFKTITAVLWQDRHTDATVHLFTDRARAEGWASAQARKYDRFGNYEETRYPDGDIDFTYSGDGDRLTVMDVEVNKEAGV